MTSRMRKTQLADEDEGKEKRIRRKITKENTTKKTVLENSSLSRGKKTAFLKQSIIIFFETDIFLLFLLKFLSILCNLKYYFTFELQLIFIVTTIQLLKQTWFPLVRRGEEAVKQKATQPIR